MRSKRSFIFGGIVAVTGLALAAPALAAKPVTVRVGIPQQVAKGGMIAVRLTVSGDAQIGGIQATVGVDGKAAEVGGIAPAGALGRSLAPVATRHGSSSGAYALKLRNGRAATIALFPDAQGRVQIRVGRVEVVSASGARLPVELVGGNAWVQVGKGTHRYAAKSPGAAPKAARHAARADVDQNGIVTLQDLNQTLYGWAAENADGDVNGDHRVDVSDVQSVFSRIAPKLRALPTPKKQATPLVPSLDPSSPLYPALGAAATATPLTFTVTTTADAVDASPGDKICAIAGGGCSLRAAIDEANRNAAADTINFNIPGGAPQVIHLTLGKLTINAAGTTINGYSEPGAHANTDALWDNALPGVEISGNGDNAKESLYITSSNTVVQGLAMHGLWKAIWMSQGANNNTIAGDFIGMSATGANTGYSGLNGILMDASSNHNTIGLPTAAGRNVIGNVGEGIDFYNTGTDYNVVKNNYVGMSPDGTQVYGIGDNGMDHNFGPKNNVEGGFGALERNVFVGAGNDGVEYSHGWNQALAPHQDTSLPYQIDDNQLLGNYIGFKPDGTYDDNFANGTCWPGCESNDNGQGLNVIDGTNRTIVNGNYIAGHRNGIQIEADWSRGNVIEHNHVGVSPTGMNAVIHDNGIFVHWDTKQNVIENNDIRNAGMAGIALDSPSVYDNQITQNTFRNIGGLGIDNYPLGAVNVNGQSANGSDRAILYPVISSATATSVSGTAPKGAVVELYVTFGQPGAYGPGRTYLTSVTANATTGAFSAPVTLNPGDVVTSTATVGTSPNVNTSEFGVNVAVPGAPPAVHGASFSDWEGFAGTGLSNIPNGTAANSTTTVGALETPTNRGDNLGSRLQALVTAPATGAYTFWIASDDNGRLFLSSNDDPANRQQIASVDNWTNPEAYDTYPSQQSAPVNLVAGHRYYVEAWAKEGSGGDNLSVAWSGPGLSRQVISDDYLTATTAGCAGWCPNATVKPYKAQLTSFAGKCADVYGGQPNDGSMITDYSCNGGQNQTWTLASNGELQAFASPHCAQVQGGIAVGSKLFLATCDGSAGETFAYSAASGHITIGGLCVEVPGADASDGVQLALNTCNSNPEQSWQFTAAATYTPDPPAITSADTSSIKGTTCTDCSVSVYSTAGGPGQVGPPTALLGTATADAHGAFSYAVAAGVLGAGAVVTAAATTPVNVTSGLATNVAVVDNSVPPAPTNLAGDTTTITGKAAANTTVRLYTTPGAVGGQGPAGSLIATVPATAGGTFSYAVQATDNLNAGTVITATATNANGPSGFATNVALTQALPPVPPAPSGLAATTAVVTGNAQAGSTVTIYLSSGSAGQNGPGTTQVGTTTATGGGTFSWTVAPAGALGAGTVVTATASNAGGPSTFATNVTVAQAAPAAPTGLVASTSAVSGSAAAGSTVTIYKTSGAVGQAGPGTTALGTTTATSGGTFSWTVDPAGAIAAGDVITATASNAGGPSGFATNVAASAVLPPPPAAPSGLAATTLVVGGNAAAGSTVTIYKTSGAVGQAGPGTTALGTTTATSGGTFSWTVNPAGAIAAGDVITATASNAGGPSGFATNVAATAPAGGPLAADAFSRIVANGWGTATTGGAYSIFSTASDYAVDGSQATMRLAAGNTRETWLTSLSAANVNSTVTFSVDKLPTGANTFVYLTARRSTAGNAYRGVIRLQPNGQVYAYVTKVVGSTETTIGAIPLISGVTAAAGTKYHARLLVTGSGTSTLKLSVWADGAAEPATPQVTVTDAQTELQGAGSAGLRAYTGAATTNAPITVRFDDWSVITAS